MSGYLKSHYKAQSLIEILLAVTLGAMLIGSSASIMAVSLKSFQKNKEHLQANVLIRQAGEVIQSLVKSNWHEIYSLAKATNYRLNLSNNVWTFSSGQETGTINNVPYRKYFRVFNVNRDASGNIAGSGSDDPNTQQITIFAEYGYNYQSSSTLTFFLTRSENNQVFNQTDWSGGSGQTWPVVNPGNRFDTASSLINILTAGQITLSIATSTSQALYSSVLDTGVSNGAGFNSLLWLGSLGSGGTVRFRIASSNASEGPWTYYGPTSTSDWHQPNPNVSVSLPTTGSASHQNKRYIRYWVELSTTGTTPTIEDISINWNP